jgi:alkylation response protein AidB-like acyl-CoA dehydrogenase
MHHFSVASVLEISPDGPGPVDPLLEAVARGNLYVASGFAEGRTGTSVLTTTVRVERGPAGLVLNGSKKPCSLSASMDLLTVSTPAPEGTGAGLAVAVVPAASPGIERRPFWSSPILAGAESDEVVLRDVPVPDDALFPAGGPGRVDALQDRSFLWFELLISASYLGIASALVERVVSAGRGGATERVALAGDLEGAMAALEAGARAMLAGERGNDALARMLLVRYAVQGAIDRATDLAVELLGGMAFIESSDVSYLLAASRALAFHPPSRLSAAGRLDRYLAGEPLVLD